MKTIKIRNKIIGDGNPIFVIGEMAWSHDGSAQNAKKIIKAVADAGGDAISMHLTHMEDYMTKTYVGSSGITVSAGKKRPSIYSYLSNINLSEKQWVDLFAYAKKLGLLICSQCNDMKSLLFSKRLRPDLYVIHSSCFVEKDYVKATAKMKKPVILRIGGATLEEIEQTISLIKTSGNDQIILLHGIQMYPSKIEDAHIRYIPTLKQMFAIPVGIADHIDAEQPFAMMPPLLAIALGANAVEKHVTHDRSKKGEDFESALNPDEFKTFVEFIHLTEKALGSSSLQFSSESERKYREVVRKKTVAKVAIKKNQLITKEKITFKRADEGVCPNETRFILGKKAKHDIKKDEGITLDKVV